MAKPEYLNPPSVKPIPNAFSNAVRYGNIVWIAGQQARNESGNIVNPGDSYEQAKLVYQRIENILKELGGDLNSLVKTVTYIVGRENLQGRGKARQELIEAGVVKNLPTATVVLVAGLGSPESVVEIDAVAVIE